jgi:hypothetical protein
MRSFLICHEGHAKAQGPKEHVILRSRQNEISSDDLDMNYDTSTLKFARMVFSDIVLISYSCMSTHAMLYCGHTPFRTVFLGKHSSASGIPLHFCRRYALCIWFLV